MNSYLLDTSALLIRAAEVKAAYPLSLADAWIAACALEAGAVLVHKDAEFQPLPVEQDMLPFKARRA